MKDDNLQALNNLKEILNRSAPKNIYEVSSAIGKRSKQILENRQESFYAELDSIGVANAEETPSLNKENWREALYNKYEKKEKPLTKAIKDIKEGKVTYHYVTNQKETY